MAYSTYQEERISNYLREKNIPFVEKKMMGGLCYMVNDKMCIGLLQNKKSGTDLLMARIGEAAYESALEKPGVLPMDFTGRPMKGYVFVEDVGFDLQSDLEDWIELCLAFNPMAKSSKKKS